MELIGLARIEENVAPILDRLARFQLTEGNQSYAPILPSLLWATVALNFEKTQFTERALEISLVTQERIPFSSKVLLA